MLLKELLKKFADHAKLFADLLSQYRREGISLDEGVESVFFQRLVPYLQHGTAETVYAVLKDLFIYLVEMPKKAKTNPVLIKASVGLLDVSSLDLTDLLYVTPYGENEKAGKVHVDDLLNDIAETPFEKQISCTDETISTAESKNDSELQKFQKRLYRAGIHVEKSGIIYTLEKRLEIGAQGSLERQPIVSLVTAIDYEFVFRYLRFINDLSKGIENVLAMFPQYGIRLAKHYQSLLNRLPVEYVKNNQEKLSTIFQKQTLCTAVLEDKVIEAAFEKSDPAKFTTWMSSRELLPLLLYRVQAPKEMFIAAFGLNRLQDLVIEFLKNRDAGFTSNLYPIQLKAIIPAKNNAIEPIWKLIKELPEQFDPKFVADFIKNHVPAENKKICIEIYYALTIQKHASQLEWLDSLDFKVANEFLNLMKSAGIKIDYLEIYNCSEDLRETDVIKAYAKRAQLPLDEIIEVKMEIQPERIPVVLPSEYQDECKMLIERTHSTEKVRTSLLALLRRYQEKNLKLAGDGTFVGKWGVPDARGTAYQQLTNQISNDDALWSGMTQLHRDAAFRRDAGYYDSSAISQSRASFTVPFTLWRRVKEIQARVVRQQKFFRAFENDKLLVRVLKDDVIYSSLTKNDLELIFRYCNRSLFIVLLKHYKRVSDAWQPLDLYGHKLDVHTINKLLLVDEKHIAETNALRDKLHISPIIPVNFERAGLPEDPRRQKLTKALLYQYSETELRAADEFLFKTYPGVIVNKLPDMKVEEVMPLNKPKTSFFHLPVSDPLFVASDDDNHNYRERSNAFKGLLKSLVASHVPNDENPLIFSGLLNLNNAHWVPFFIYKNARNEIQVICLDPSPETTRDEDCPKYKAFTKLRNIFGEIFPGCVYSDPNVTQQLRQRDCGPNALTVLVDAYRTSTSNQPLLTVVDGRLRMNTDSLTVNCNTQRLYDHDNRAYCYSPEATEIGKRNRKRWAMRLRDVDQVTTLIYPTPLSITGEFATLVVDPYSYDRNVKLQNNHDEMETLYSLVAVEIGDISRMQEAFVRSLVCPGIDNLKSIIEKNERIMAEISRYGTTAEVVLNIVIGNNLRPYYVAALIENFDKFLATHQLDKICDQTVDTKIAMINAYVNGSGQASAGFFALLLPNEKTHVMQAITLKAEGRLGKMINDFHVGNVKKALKEDMGNFLKKLPGASDQRIHSLIVELIALFKESNPAGASFKSMAETSPDELKKFVHQAIEEFIIRCAKKTDEYLNYVIAKLSLIEIAGLTDEKPSIFSSGINNLLPDEKSANVQGVLQQNDLLLSVGKPNALAPFMPDKLDAKIQLSIDKRLEKILADTINKALQEKNDELAGLSISKLNSIATNVEEAKQVANSLSLFEFLNEVKPISRYIYAQAVEKILDLLRAHVEERLRVKMNSAFPVVSENLHFSGIDFAAVSMEDKIDSNKLVTDIVKNLANSDQLLPAQSQTLESFLPEEKSDNATTPILQAFVRNYKDQIMQQIQNDDKRISEFCGMANNYLSLLDLFEFDFNCYVREMGSLFVKTEFSDDKIESFIKIQESIRGLILSARECYQKSSVETTTKLAELTTQLHAEFLKYIRFVTENYRVGNTSTDRFTSRLRVRLCQNLNIPMQLNRDFLPTFLSTQQAMAIDNAIIDYFHRLLHNGIPADFSVMARFNVRMPCYVTGSAELPSASSTYAKFLTPKILTQFAANWRMLCKKEWSFGLTLLVSAINKLPVECQDNENLPIDWCDRNILPIFQNETVRKEISRNKTTEAFAFAIANSRSFTPATPQEEKTAVKLSEIENIVALYHSAKTARPAQVARFVNTAGFAQPTDSEEKLGAYLKAGFWEKQDDIRKIEKVIERIRRRHPAAEDVVLDRGDLELFQDVLRLRWAALQVKANGNAVTNYETYPLATDRAFYAIAELVRQGLANLTQNPVVISNRKLLVPPSPAPKV